MEVTMSPPGGPGLHRDPAEELPYPLMAPVVWGLTQTSWPRSWCLRIANSPLLNCVSTLFVLVNCVSVGMYQPDHLTRSSTQNIMDSITFSFFLMEMLVKMLARGFGCERSYLSNKWNRMDFIIILAEMLDIFVGLFGINIFVRAVVGPMRLISRVPCMRDMMTIILEVIPMLTNSLLIMMVLIYLFGIIGVQLWAGQLRNRCFLGDDIPIEYNVSLRPYYMATIGERVPFICSLDGMDGMRRCTDVPPYKKNGHICSLMPPYLTEDGFDPVVAGPGVNACVNWNVYYNVCRTGNRNPNEGAINFDHIGYAWLTMFQVVTLEGWLSVMSYVMDAYSFWSCLFFIPVTIMGSFVMMNVCAVVVASKFSNKLEEVEEEQSGRGRGPAACVTWLWSKLNGFCQRRRSQNQGGSESRRIVSRLLTKWKKKAKRCVESRIFKELLMRAVVLSIITIAMEHHNQSARLTLALKIVNGILNLVFALEMILKLLALGWSYFKDPHNVFDFFLVMISGVNLLLPMSILLSLRVLRIGRLLHYVPYMKRQLLVLKRSFSGGAPLCLILLLTIFIFSIEGMRLFAGKFDYKTRHGDIVTHRANFDTLLWSMVTVFQILTEEGWNLVMYNGMGAVDPSVALYFIAIFVVGKLVLLNILMGFVFRGLQKQAEPSSSDENHTQPVSSAPTDGTQPENPPEEQPYEPLHEPPDEPPYEPLHEPPDEPPYEPLHEPPYEPLHEPPDEPPYEPLQEPPAEPPDEPPDDDLWTSLTGWCNRREDWSLYLLSPQNRIRILSQRVSSHKVFDYTVLLCILLNFVTIAMERPGIQPQSTERWILYVSSYVFTAIFLAEMLIKVAALGLFLGKESYCRCPWNVMDGSLVVLSLVHILISQLTKGKNNIVGIVKVLRMLRALRPLRLIKRAPKLKLAVEALIASIRPVVGILFICGSFYLFYGILGVQLFKGKFYYCKGMDVRRIKNKSDCLSANYRWLRREYNFDNLAQATVTLFVMYSKDGWVDIMYNGMDAVGVDQQPVRNYNVWVLPYFISFAALSFVLLDMFIGVMVDTFHKCQIQQKRAEEAAGIVSPRVTDEEVFEPGETPYYMSYSPMRRNVHTVCTSKYLDHFMMAIIFSSVLVMSLEHYEQSVLFEKVTDYTFYVFTVMLIAEVLLKLVAFGPRRFIRVRWNQLDVTVIFTSVASIFLDQMALTTFSMNPSILRCLRLLRLAQVLTSKNIRILLKTFTKTLLQIKSIGLLFGFFFFIFAALGVELFGKLECADDYKCLGINERVNFRHFGMALLTLYQVCTGDNWSGVMKDTLRPCRPGDDGCSDYLYLISPIYFTAFVVVVQFVLLNLVVAVISQALDDSTKQRTAIQEVRPPSHHEGEHDGTETSV